MQSSEKLVFNTLTAGQQFLDEHAAALGTIPSGARVRLDTIVDALEQHGDAKTVHKMSSKALAQTKSAARRALVADHLAPIAAAARAVLAETPELMVVRTVPPIGMSNEALIRRAEEVVKAIAPYATQLVAAGLPSDFQAGLDTARQALEAATYDRVTSLKKTHGASTGIREQLAAGRRQLRIIDRLVRVALRGQDGSLLAEWKGRTAYPKARSTVVAGATTPPATPAPSTTAPSGAAAA